MCKHYCCLAHSSVTFLLWLTQHGMWPHTNSVHTTWSEALDKTKNMSILKSVGLMVLLALLFFVSHIYVVQLLLTIYCCCTYHQPYAHSLSSALCLFVVVFLTFTCSV